MNKPLPLLVIKTENGFIVAPFRATVSMRDLNVDSLSIAASVGGRYDYSSGPTLADVIEKHFEREPEPKQETDDLPFGEPATLSLKAA